MVDTRVLELIPGCCHLLRLRLRASVGSGGRGMFHPLRWGILRNYSSRHNFSLDEPIDSSLSASENHHGLDGRRSFLFGARYLHFYSGPLVFGRRDQVFTAAVLFE